jgi:hypothetical protein
MDQISNLADDRLINGCIYCGGPAETRDHVPSRVFLDPPYPENLPVVGACRECNQGFSKDEEYFVCWIESARAVSTDPSKIMRTSVARAMERSPALRTRIEASIKRYEDQIEFGVETDRIKNVMLKLARGHAAFELSQPCREEPDQFWCGPLMALSKEERELFNAPHMQQMFGEIGSRGLQRLLVTEMVLQTEKGDKSVFRCLVNDWIDVQENYYRYLAIDDVGGLVIRIVIAELYACEIAWRKDPKL